MKSALWQTKNRGNLTRESTTVRETPEHVTKPSSDDVSGGEAHSSDRGTAPSSIQSPETTKLDAEMLAEWKALQEMVCDEKSPIIGVSWIAQDGKPIKHSPVFIGLPDPSNEKIAKELEPHAIAWLYLDKTTRERLRSVMILRVKTTTGIGYILEIQRRPGITKDGHSQSTGDYRGLAIKLDNDDILPEWIDSLLLQTANTVGVVSKIIHSTPGQGYAFKHLGIEKGGIKSSIKTGLLKSD